MGLRDSCQDLLLLRDWSWGKAVTHSPGLVTLLVKMMALGLRIVHKLKQPCINHIYFKD